MSVAPKEDNETIIVFEEAKTEADKARLGTQFTGMTLTIETEDLDQTYQYMKASGVEFVEEPNDAPWGKQAAFKALYSNVFDLVALATH